MLRGTAIGLVVLALAGCNTVTAPFVRMAPDYSTVPEEVLREVALEIEQAIQAGDRDAAIASRGGVVVDTPEIRQAIRTRAARSEILGEFLDTGFGREVRRGLVSIIRNKAYKSATTKQERDRNALLVMGENGNRWTIYEGIVEASNLSPKALSAVQAVFFDAQVACLKAGQKYEGADGAITAKGQ